MRGRRLELQVRPEAYEGARLGRERLQALRGPPHRRGPGPGGEARRGHPRYLCSSEEHNIPERGRRALRVRGRRQDIHRRKRRGLFGVSGLPPRVLRRVREDDLRGHQGRGRRPPDKSDDSDNARFQGGHSAPREGVGGASAPDVVLLQRRGEGVRPLRLLQAQAQGVRGSRIQGRDRV